MSYVMRMFLCSRMPGGFLLTGLLFCILQAFGSVRCCYSAPAYRVLFPTVDMNFPSFQHPLPRKLRSSKIIN
ncbi:hypothetical protein F5B17DRAFT_414562 [Nemania serpens]|nr:hypothetical protein F5B17DRAFT_414562 [Nemania serpens]